MFAFAAGKQEDAYYSSYLSAIEVTTANAQSEFCVGADTTTSFATASFIAFAPTTNVYLSSGSVPWVSATIGAHFIAALEKSDGTNNSPFNLRSGALLFKLRM